MLFIFKPDEKLYILCNLTARVENEQVLETFISQAFVMREGNSSILVFELCIMIVLH